MVASPLASLNEGIKGYFIVPNNSKKVLLYISLGQLSNQTKDLNDSNKVNGLKTLDEAANSILMVRRHYNILISGLL